MRRYLWLFFAPVLLVMASAASLLFFYQPITGDLTRIGRWAERDFGWNAEPPRIAIHASGDMARSADIWVLGDSFSEKNIWQSILAEATGKTFLSFHYEQVGCLDSWLQVALADPSVRTVLVEVVERSFLNVFASRAECEQRVPGPLEIAPAITAHARPAWPSKFSISYAFMTGIHSARLAMPDAGVLRDKVVVNAPLRSACASFSNRRADRLLYFADDELQQRWKPESVAEAIAHVQRIQTLFTQHGKHFALVLVPDKLSVYQHCLVPDTGLPERNPINQRLIAAGIHVPNLIGPLRESVGSVVDLYLPNDTHFSTGGYQLMAAQLRQYMDGAGLW